MGDLDAELTTIQNLAFMWIRMVIRREIIQLWNGKAKPTV